VKSPTHPFNPSAPIALDPSYQGFFRTPTSTQMPRTCPGVIRKDSFHSDAEGLQGSSKGIKGGRVIKFESIHTLNKG
jgi:hypothetical protein